MPSFDTPEDYQKYIDSPLSGWQYDQSRYDKGDIQDTSWRDQQSGNSRNSNNITNEDEND